MATAVEEVQNAILTLYGTHDPVLREQANRALMAFQETPPSTSLPFYPKNRAAVTRGKTTCAPDHKSRGNARHLFTAVFLDRGVGWIGNYVQRGGVFWQAQIKSSTPAYTTVRPPELMHRGWVVAGKRRRCPKSQCHGQGQRLAACVFIIACVWAAFAPCLRVL